MIVFFQAEDGIRDLVRSRGLGDVYKRQLQIMIEGPLGGAAFNNEFGRSNLGGYFRVFEQTAVSYTHLTLPTSDLV